jgi:hypothetical protein
MSSCQLPPAAAAVVLLQEQDHTQAKPQDTTGGRAAGSGRSGEKNNHWERHAARDYLRKRP